MGKNSVKIISNDLTIYDFIYISTTYVYKQIQYEQKYYSIQNFTWNTISKLSKLTDKCGGDYNKQAFRSSPPFTVKKNRTSREKKR